MTVSSMRRRCLAIFLPYLATDRLRRRPSDAFCALPDDAPLVVVDKVRNALTVVAADRAAGALGLKPGLALTDARARVPDITVAEAAPAADGKVIARLADWCDRYTPFVARDPPDGVMLDITGCAHLLAGEPSLRSDVLTRLTRFGFSARVVIASAPDAARALARFSDIAIVPPGQNQAAVHPLPIDALCLEADVTTALRRAGLKTIGALAARPRAPLAARFGSGLLDRLDRTLGVNDVPISPRRVIAACQLEQSFAEPLQRLEDAITTLSLLATRLARELEARGQGGRHFEASFFRVDGAVRHIAVGTARACRDPEALIRLFRDRLDALAEPIDAGFGFDLLRLAAVVTEPRPHLQQQLDGEMPSEDALAGLIDRLSARLGADRVVRFARQDTHIPEHAVRHIAALTTGTGEGRWPASAPVDATPGRPISLFNPPQPIEAIAAVPDGPPLRFRWRRVLHAIKRAEGPERIAPEWWREGADSLTRDYYRVEDHDGRRFWLFREGLYGRETDTPRWFLHGLFT